jgi:hypothetical protein
MYLFTADLLQFSIDGIPWETYGLEGAAIVHARATSTKVKSRSKRFFTGDAEFYHDRGGLTLGSKSLTESIKKNICGGDVRRELVPGTLEAHLMKGYGALEIGVHRFYHPKSSTPSGEGRFIMLWQYKDGAWKITRAISFDHHVATK